MADHFEFRSDKTDPKETHLKFDTKDVIISTYNTGGGKNSKPAPEFQHNDAGTDFIDDFSF